MKRISQLVDWLGSLRENPFVVAASLVESRRPVFARLWSGYGAYLLLSFVPLGLTVGAFQALGREGVQGVVQCVAALLAFLQVVYVAVRAVCNTSTSVVTERATGTLVTLAMTRMNSADYADGVAAAAVRPIARELTVLLPIPVGLGVLAGADFYALAILYLVSLLVASVAAYGGILISATSRDAVQACNRGICQAVAALLVTPFLFPLGGCLAGPLWLLHPFTALALAFWGAQGQAQAGDLSVFVLRWWALASLPLYLGVAREVRRRAIRALERVRLS